MTNLPNDITPRHYDGDIVLTGPNLTAAAFNDIKTAMKPEERQHVIGWLRTGR